MTTVQVLVSIVLGIYRVSHWYKRHTTFVIDITLDTRIRFC